MQHKKPLMRAASLALAGALALTACSPGNSEESEGGSKQLTIWTLQMEEAQQTAWDELVAAFEEQNDGVTVTTETRQVDAHKDALRQVAGTDAGPDLYRYWGGYGLGGTLVEVGMSADLTKYYEEYGWGDLLTPAALANATQYDDHHGVPFIQSTEAVFYNKNLFEQAGITELPTTYDELIDAAEKLLAAGITPMEFGGTVNWHVMRLLDSIIETTCGAETADTLTQGDGDWGNESCVTESFTQLKTWGDKYLNQGFMAVSNDDSSQLFYSGTAAMTIEGDWFGPMAIENGLTTDDIGIFTFPTGTDRVYGFGELFYMTPGAKNPDLAAQFLDFMISAQGQELLGSAFSAISVNKDVQPAEGTPLAEEWQGIINSAQGSYINNDQNFGTAETTEFWRIQNSVLTGGIAPDNAGAEFQKWRDANR